MATIRLVVLSGLFCLILPVLFGMNGVWLAIPLSDMLTALMGLFFVNKSRTVLDPHAAS